MKKHTQKRTLNIIIAVYNEPDIIKNTINFFKNCLIKYDSVLVYYVTTEKEGRDINSSYSIISKYIDNKKQKIIHFPKRLGAKAEQINYAISKLKKNKNTYFAFFDADSRPDFRGIDYVLEDKLDEKVYQMVSIYSLGFMKNNFVSRGNAIFQSSWSLRFEFFNIFKNFRFKSMKHLMYLVGHGLVVRSDLFYKLKFPTNTLTEDIIFGYSLCVNNIFAKPVPFFDHCSVPTSLLSQIKQTGRWYAGELGLISVLKNNYSLNNVWKFMLRYLQLVLWPLESIFNITLVIYLIFHFNTLILVLYVIYLGIIGYLHTRINYYFDLKHFSLKDILGVYFKYFYNWIGPMYAIIRKMFDLLKIYKYDFEKTQRD